MSGAGHHRNGELQARVNRLLALNAGPKGARLNPRQRRPHVPEQTAGSVDLAYS